MPSPHRIRSKEEKRLIDAANQLLDDPASTNAERLKAMGMLERAIRLAEKRRQERREDADWFPADPTVDDLVSALEAKKAPEKADSDALEARTTPPEPAKPRGDTQTAPQPDEEKAHQEQALQAVQDIADGKKPLPALEPVPPVPKCWNCDQPGQPTWDDRVLCPAHLASEAARQAREAAAGSLARQKTDWAEGFNTQRRANTSDFAASVAIWEQQAREDSVRQEQEAAERVRLEAGVNRRRADWIQNGGRL